MRGYVLESDGTVRETEDLADIRAARASNKPLWLDLEQHTDEANALLLDTFHLHPLTVEDLWGTRALPKVEGFDDYLFVLVHGVRREGDPPRIHVVELDIVIGSSFVITHHDQPSRSVEAVRHELSCSSKLLKRGPAWVLHSLLDHLVDHYVPVLDEYDEVIETLEQDVIDKAGTPKGRKLMSRIFELKRDLQALRRVSAHQREILMRLSRAEFPEIPQEATPFFRDVYDHFARVSDLAEGYRELVTSTMEAYLSVQGNRMNEVMKALTLISTVMLPLTFIAGVYGMNFEVMPELRWHYGYAAVLILMLITSVSIVAFFRHKRWL
jgi:magnesium transporter